MIPPMQRNVPKGSLVRIHGSGLSLRFGIASRPTAKIAPSKDSQGKREQRAGQAQPRGQQSHELGIAESHPFATPDEPVEPADEEDQDGRGKNAEYVQGRSILKASTS